MNSRQVWPQLGTQAAVRHPASQPLLQPVYEGCEGTFEPLALGALAVPPQLRMLDCTGISKVHTGFSTGVGKELNEEEWEQPDSEPDSEPSKKRDKQNCFKRNCCSMDEVRYAFCCNCDPCLCFSNIVHFIF